MRCGNRARPSAPPSTESRMMNGSVRGPTTHHCSVLQLREAPGHSLAKPPSTVERKSAALYSEVPSTLERSSPHSPAKRPSCLFALADRLRLLRENRAPVSSRIEVQLQRPLVAQDIQHIIEAFKQIRQDYHPAWLMDERIAEVCIRLHEFKETYLSRSAEASNTRER